MKLCKKCNTIKSFANFHKDNRNNGYQSKCISCDRAYKLANDDKQKLHKRNHYLRNRDEFLLRSKEYRKNNKARRNENEKNYLSIPENRIVHSLRNRLGSLITSPGDRFNATLNLVGCSKEDLKKRIERQFKKGMSWDNYGEWQIDHKIPCKKFDFTNEQDQKDCFHYSNLQPMWRSENASKQDRILTPTQIGISL